LGNGGRRNDAKNLKISLRKSHERKCITSTHTIELSMEGFPGDWRKLSDLALQIESVEVGAVMFALRLA
jgi:hypothetical protein